MGASGWSETCSERRKLKINHAAAMRTDCRQRAIYAVRPIRTPLPLSSRQLTTSDLNLRLWHWATNLSQLTEDGEATRHSLLNMRPQHPIGLLRGHGRMTTRKQLYSRSTVCPCCCPSPPLCAWYLYRPTLQWVQCTKLYLELSVFFGCLVLVTYSDLYYQRPHALGTFWILASRGPPYILNPKGVKCKFASVIVHY